VTATQRSELWDREPNNLLDIAIAGGGTIDLSSQRCDVHGARRVAEQALEDVRVYCWILGLQVQSDGTHLASRLSASFEALCDFQKDVDAALSNDVLRTLELASFDKDTSMPLGDSIYPTAHEMVRVAFAKLRCCALHLLNSGVDSESIRDIRRDELFASLCELRNNADKVRTALSFEWRRACAMLQDRVDIQDPVQEDRGPELVDRSPGAEYDDPSISAADLAARFNVTDNAAKGRLARFRKKHADGWNEIVNPKRGEPRYSYQLSAVKHLFVK
jgi:hypothetical protein